MTTNTGKWLAEHGLTIDHLSLLAEGEFDVMLQAMQDGLQDDLKRFVTEHKAMLDAIKQAYQDLHAPDLTILACQSIADILKSSLPEDGE